VNCGATKKVLGCHLAKLIDTKCIKNIIAVLTEAAQTNSAVQRISFDNELVHFFDHENWGMINIFRFSA